MKLSLATKSNITKLDNVLNKAGTLLILSHDYPDPDALASALALSYLAHKRYSIRTSIVYGGHIARAENRAMVQQLKMKLLPVEEIQWQRYRMCALVDTQPAFGNHSLPENIRPSIVIDHHPEKKPLQADFVDVRPGYGASATILLEYIVAAELDISVDIATAVTYAIRSETQELGREASSADVNVYLAVYPKSNKRILAKITHPKLPKTYFDLLHTALQNARVYRHLAHVHLGKVETPEFVPQIADLLLQHERIGWSIASGRFEEQLYISLRCTHPHANAGNMLRQIIGTMGFAGGHPMVAGGRIPYNSHNDKEWQRLEEFIINRFLGRLGIKKEVEWKSILVRNST